MEQESKRTRSTTFCTARRSGVSRALTTKHTQKAKKPWPLPRRPGRTYELQQDSVIDAQSELHLPRVVIDSGDFSKIGWILDVVFERAGKDLTLDIPKNCSVEGVEELSTEIHGKFFSNLGAFYDPKVFVEVGEESDVSKHSRRIANRVSRSY
jgi:hypothetical protein